MKNNETDEEKENGHCARIFLIYIDCVLNDIFPFVCPNDLQQCECAMTKKTKTKLQH